LSISGFEVTISGHADDRGVRVKVTNVANDLFERLSLKIIANEYGRQAPIPELFPPGFDPGNSNSRNVHEFNEFLDIPAACLGALNHHDERISGHQGGLRDARHGKITI
jgi:hypothetical protein